MVQKHIRFRGKTYTFSMYAPYIEYARAMVNGNTPQDPREFRDYRIRVIRNPAGQDNVPWEHRWLIYKRSKKLK